MKKFMNAVDDVLTESLDGLVAAHSDILTLGGGHKFIRRKVLKPGKVALISGGGSGHEPLHGGLVGHGMLDAACPGQVFTSPTPDQMMEAAAEVDTGAGCLFIVKNYEGDVMNFDMAAEMSADVPGGVLQVVTNDDVAVEDSLYTTGRRGVAGTLVVEKIVGAAAEEGRTLHDLKALGDKVNRATRSMGVALTSCTVPAAGKPNFEIADDEMEFGVGIHGEPGRRRAKLLPADAITEEICAAIVGDLGAAARGDALLFVNGFGGTPSMELYLMYNSARKALEKHGVRIARALVGSYVTSLEMAGCSITLSMLDDESARLWDAPVHTAALRWGM
jgi:dihydroxyacetone kinase-like protein